MKNQFKLQPVLNYRQTLEDQAKQDLGRCLQKEAELMEAIQVEEQDLGALYRNLERRQQQGSVSMNCCSIKIASVQK